MGTRSLLALSCILALAACKSRKETVVRRDQPPRSGEKLLERLLATQPDTLPYYSAKAEVEVSGMGNDRSFKATLRSVQDSALWVSINVILGIEAARAVITADSLKAIDKINDRYWLGDTAQARSRFGATPGLELLQQVLLGRAVGLDATEKYRSDREDGLYVLTSRDKRRFVRAAEDLAPEDTLPSNRDMSERRMERTLRKAEEKDAVVFRYWIEPDSFRVVRVLVSDLGRDRQADVRYEARDVGTGHALPTRIVLSLSDGTRVLRVRMDLSRIELNGPLHLPFRIPEKFFPMD